MSITAIRCTGEQYKSVSLSLLAISRPGNPLQRIKPGKLQTSAQNNIIDRAISESEISTLARTWSLLAAARFDSGAEIWNMKARAAACRRFCLIILSILKQYWQGKWTGWQLPSADSSAVLIWAWFEWNLSCPMDEF